MALDQDHLPAAHLPGDEEEGDEQGDAHADDGGTSETKSSKYRGVSWHKKSGRWRATIKLQGQKLQIGAYRDEEEAARAFDGAAVMYRGATAITNFDIAEYLPEQIEHEERTALQVPVVFSARNPSGSFLDMSAVPVFASFSPSIQPGPPPVSGNPNVPDCDLDLEQRDMALQWARAKLYLQEMAGNHNKNLKRARLGQDHMRGAARDDDVL